MRHTHYTAPHILRELLLSGDEAIRNVSELYRAGRLTVSDAIVTLREAGICEPEIREALTR